MTITTSHLYCTPDLIVPSKASSVATKPSDTALASPPLTPTDTTCLALPAALQFNNTLATAAATATAAAAAADAAAAATANTSLVFSSQPTSDHDKPMGTLSLSQTSPSPLPSVPHAVKRLSGSRPRRTHAKFSEVMEDKVIAQSIAAQARSRYRKIQPHGRSLAVSGPRAPIEGTVQLNVFQQYKIDPKPLLLPAVVPSPVIRESAMLSQAQTDSLGWYGQNDSEAFSPSPSPPPPLPPMTLSMPSSSTAPQQPDSHRSKQHYGTDRNGRTAPNLDHDNSNTLSSIFEVTDDQLESHLMRETSPQPDTAILNVRKPRITWKGSPLHISNHRCYETLHPTEALIASTLRLTPILYLKCRHTLLLAARDHTNRSVPFRKSDAQKLCRVDVNKTSRLWEIFGEIGWLGDDWPGL